MKKNTMIEVNGELINGYIKKFEQHLVMSDDRYGTFKEYKPSYAFVPKDYGEKMRVSFGYPTDKLASFMEEGFNVLKEDFSLDKKSLDTLIKELIDIRDQIDTMNVTDKLE